MSNLSQQYDVIIIGAGAAGLMCAAQAGQRGRSTLLLEHNDEVGRKILISGGGRCNFTNLNVTHENYLSENMHFCKSALAQYTNWDFLNLVQQYQIPYHEKTLGQQFCDDNAKDIVNMLLSECHKGNVKIQTSVQVSAVSQPDHDLKFEVISDSGTFSSTSLVIATGALSFPRLGVSDIGYRIAEQFDLHLTSRTPALVPFTFDKSQREIYESLSGMSIDCHISCQGQSFRENILFTHKGLSGPAILQISSYWKPGQSVELNLLPELNLEEHIHQQKHSNPKQQIKTLLGQVLPKRFAEHLTLSLALEEINLASLSNHQIHSLLSHIQPWTIVPAGTEGYRKKAYISLVK